MFCICRKRRRQFEKASEQLQPKESRGTEVRVVLSFCTMSLHSTVGISLLLVFPLLALPSWPPASTQGNLHNHIPRVIKQERRMWLRVPIMRSGHDASVFFPFCHHCSNKIEMALDRNRGQSLHKAAREGSPGLSRFLP